MDDSLESEVTHQTSWKRVDPLIEPFTHCHMVIRGYAHSTEPYGCPCVAPGHAIAWQTEVDKDRAGSGPGAGRAQKGARPVSRGGIENFILHLFANSREFTIAQTGV